MRPTLLSLLSCLVSLASLAFALGPLNELEDRRNAKRVGLGLKPIATRNNRRDFVMVDDTRDMTHMSIPSSGRTTGHIAVYKQDVNGPLLGYLSTNRVVSRVAATTYSFVRSASVVEISVVDTDAHLAVAAGYYGDEIGPDLKNFHVSRHTTYSSPAGARPIRDGNASSSVETTIFYLNPKTNELTVRWINPDESFSPAHIFVGEGVIYYAGDVEEFINFATMPLQRAVYKWVEKV